MDHASRFPSLAFGPVGATTSEVWLCKIEGLGLTFVSPVDDSDPVAGVDCQKVVVEDSGASVSKWNAFNQVLRLLLEL